MMLASWLRNQPPEELALVAAANAAIATERAHDWAIVEVFDRALTRRLHLDGIDAVLVVAS